MLKKILFGLSLANSAFAGKGFVNLESVHNVNFQSLSNSPYQSAGEAKGFLILEEALKAANSIENPALRSFIDQYFQRLLSLGVFPSKNIQGWNKESGRFILEKSGMSSEEIEEYSSYKKNENGNQEFVGYFGKALDTLFNYQYKFNDVLSIDSFLNKLKLNLFKLQDKVSNEDFDKDAFKNEVTQIIKDSFEVDDNYINNYESVLEGYQDLRKMIVDYFVSNVNSIDSASSFKGFCVTFSYLSNSLKKLSNVYRVSVFAEDSAMLFNNNFSQIDILLSTLPADISQAYQLVKNNNAAFAEVVKKYNPEGYKEVFAGAYDSDIE